MSEKLPLEVLREKYIPIHKFPELYGVSEDLIMSLIDCRKLIYAEFREPGSPRRCIHVNPDDLFKVLEKGKDNPCH